MNLRIFGYITTLAFFWSFTFLLIRILVETLSPLTLSFFRLLIAGLFLMTLSGIMKKNFLQYYRKIKIFIVSSILLNALPFTFCALGETHIDSSTAAIIEGTTPLFTMFFALLFFGVKEIKRKELLAFMCAFFGLLVIFSRSFIDNITSDLIGGIYLLIMAASFAMGFLFSEKYLKTVPPLEATTFQMTLAPIILFPFTYSFDSSFSFPIGWDWLFLVLLALSTAGGWLVYFRAMHTVSVRYLSLATMICPIISIVWGRIFLHEPITFLKVLGTLIVIISLWMLKFHPKDTWNKINQLRKNMIK